MFLENIQQDILKLKNLKTAVIDSSSMIYLSKINLLRTVAECVQLSAPAGVFMETECKENVVHKVNSTNENLLPVDDQVLLLVKTRHSTLISDDKKILKQAEQEGLDYLNTLMIVLMLYLRGYLNKKQTEEKLNQLKHIAWYNSFVWSYGEKIIKALTSEINGRRS